MGERNMFNWWAVSPVWTPMSRNDQHIYLCFGPPHHFEKLPGPVIRQSDRHVKNSWLIFCCFPTWFIVRESDQSESDAFGLPVRWLRCVTKRRACAAVVNTSHIQIFQSIE